MTLNGPATASMRMRIARSDPGGRRPGGKSGGRRRGSGRAMGVPEGGGAAVGPSAGDRLPRDVDEVLLLRGVVLRHLAQESELHKLGLRVGLGHRGTSFRGSVRGVNVCYH